MRRVFHPETNGVKASPHRHKWMLSHGAPADPSDPWNSHAAPVSPRQNCALRSKRTVSCLKNSVGMRSRWVRITFGGVTSGTGGRSPPWDAHGPAGPAHNAAASTMLAMALRYPFFLFQAAEIWSREVEAAGIWALNINLTQMHKALPSSVCSSSTTSLGSRANAQR